MTSQCLAFISIGKSTIAITWKFIKLTKREIFIFYKLECSIFSGVLRGEAIGPWPPRKGKKLTLCLWVWFRFVGFKDTFKPLGSYVSSLL